MALAVLRLDGDRAVLANAAMPPLLHHRAASGEIEEVLLPGMPLGGLADGYGERRFAMAPGDTLLLYSDGLPEQPDSSGVPVGYEYVARAFGGLVGETPEGIAGGLAAALDALTGGEAPRDDVTLLVLRRR